MIFTLFACLGAGIFAMQGLLAFFGKGAKIQLPALIASLVAIGIGGVGSFLHLQHWERIFNGFGHLTSGITQELIAMVVFVIALLVYFLMVRKSENNIVPKWCGIMALAIAVLFVFVMAHSYNMAARPVWDTPILWFYYLANAAFAGSLALAFIAGIKKDDSAGFLAKIAVVVGIVLLIITAIYGGFFVLAAGSYTNVGLYFDPTQPTKEMVDPSAVFASVFVGENALLFWGGVFVIGLVIPIALAFLTTKKEPQTVTVYAVIALVCALVGGICFRAILYVLGASVFLFY